MIRQRLYNPAQLTPDELKASFVAREETLAEMLHLLREQTAGRPCQHMMLVGPRGMGKTTLGLRFLHAVKETSNFATDWQPVPFYEESYEIGDLADFWLAALRHLTRATDDPTWADRADTLVEDERDGERRAAYALAALMDFCRLSGRRLILFVENLDGIMEQMRNEREAHSLRAILIERPEILLLGSANAVFEAIRSHGRPFYEFFRLIVLEGIGREETGRLLAVLADSEERPDISVALNGERGRLETLRRLTGGNPRLLVLACRMLIESPLSTAFEDLERLVDEQTPYFKARIEQLPIQARKVFHCLADGWKPMLAKEVAAAANLSSSHASAQIRQLLERGYAREVRLPSQKRVRYEVGDRFYNIYYLLRFSRTNRQRLERFVAFLHDLFGTSGMRPMYPAFLEALRADGPRAGVSSDWLEILAGYVAADMDFPGRRDWQREALELANDLIGPDALVAQRIQKTFTVQCPTSQSNLGEWRQRGADLLKAEHFSAAEELYRKVIEIQPDNLIAQNLLGVTLSLRERYDDAITAFDRVLEHIPTDDSLRSRTLIVGALAGKSIACYQLKRGESAVVTSGRISEHVGPNDSAWLRRMAASACWINGSILADSNRPEEAIDTWHRVLEYVRPDDPVNSRHVAARVLKSTGDVLAKMEQQDRAIAAWQLVTEYVDVDDAAELRQEAALALIAKGITLFPEDYDQDSTLENYKDSIAAWQFMSGYVRPDDPMKFRLAAATILSIAGDLLNLYGEFSTAETASRKAVEIDPTHDESWRVLAEAILRQTDDARLPEAEECARRAVDLGPENPVAFRTLSDVLACLGKWTEALDGLEKVLRIGSEDFRISEEPSLTESLIHAVAAGHGRRIKRMMEEAELVEPMEPLWHAVQVELGEELEPLPAEIMDTVTEIRQRFAEKQS